MGGRRGSGMAVDVVERFEIEDEETGVNGSC